MNLQDLSFILQPLGQKAFLFLFVNFWTKLEGKVTLEHEIPAMFFFLFTEAETGRKHYRICKNCKWELR